MKLARFIAGLTRQARAAWIVVLLLLVWSFGADQRHAGSAPVAHQGAIGLQGTPELAAVQVKPSPVPRLTDDRYGTGPDASLPVNSSGSDAILLISDSLAWWSPDGPPGHEHSPHSPRAPPGACPNAVFSCGAATCAIRCCLDAGHSLAGMTQGPSTCLAA